MTSPSKERNDIMKKEYLKPNVEYIVLLANESIANEEIDSSLGLVPDDEL
jgi:hypothetical protein